MTPVAGKSFRNNVVKIVLEGGGWSEVWCLLFEFSCYQAGVSLNSFQLSAPPRSQKRSELFAKGPVQYS